jgi:glutamate racemase
MTLLAFDSGIGGLGVVAQIRRLQPDQNIIYLADNSFFPYGEKPDDVLLPHITALIGRAIATHRPDAVVIPCNTASTIALSTLRATYPEIPFIGCVPPVKPAAAASQTRHIGLLATPATIRRPYLQNLIDEFADGCTIHSLGSPVLATLAEQKFRGHKVDIAGAVAPLFAGVGAQKIDAVVIGCTHYTFLLPELQALYPNLAFFDPALPVARQTQVVTAALENRPGEDAAYFTAPLPDAADMALRLQIFGLKLALSVPHPA